MTKNVIIVAGGSGSRMQSELPKQFLLLDNQPILMHTIQAFERYDSSMQIILVLPAGYLDTWQELVNTYKFKAAHQVVIGGTTRFDSVKNGLELVKEGLVAIHDGARPLVSKEMIVRCFQTAQQKGNAIAAVAPKDSIRVVHSTSNKAVDRAAYRIIQTPQTFQVEIIKAAFKEAKGNEFTDDASVAESYGHEIHLVEGEYTNLKITTPEDLVLAEAILKNHK